MSAGGPFSQSVYHSIVADLRKALNNHYMQYKDNGNYWWWSAKEKRDALNEFVTSLKDNSKSDLNLLLALRNFLTEQHIPSDFQPTIFVTDSILYAKLTPIVETLSSTIKWLAHQEEEQSKSDMVCSDPESEDDDRTPDSDVKGGRSASAPIPILHQHQHQRAKSVYASSAPSPASPASRLNSPSSGLRSAPSSPSKRRRRRKAGM